MDFLYTMFTFLAAALLLILIAISALIIQIFTGKSIKDPKYSPVLGTVFHQLFHFSKLHDYLGNFAEKHHTFRLLAPDHSEIFTTDTRNVEYMLKTNFDNYTRGEYNIDIMTDLFGHGIFNVDGAKWRQQRKLASYEFSTRVLRDFSSGIFRKTAAKIVTIVTKLSEGKEAFDIQDLLMRSTLDSIFKVGFGVELNCLEGSSKEGREFIKAFDDSNAFTCWRYADPLWKLKRFLNIGCEASLGKNIKFINRFVLSLIAKRRELLELQQDSNEKEDILSRFLVESKKDPDQINDHYLMDIILNFMIAGKDTTANTLSWLFYMLCKNPLVQEKIVQETRELFGNQGSEQGSIDNFVASITEEVLEKMHYLHAALTETLRLYPPVPLDGRVAETDDTLPDGFKVKKGDGLSYLGYAMGRASYIWGDDAEDFKPERWLKNGIFEPESPFKFVSFHAGPRVCIGKHFAYRQMKIISSSLLCFFRFRLADEKKDVTYQTMFTLHVEGGLHLLAVPRTY